MATTTTYRLRIRVMAAIMVAALLGFIVVMARRDEPLRVRLLLIQAAMLLSAYVIYLARQLTARSAQEARAADGRPPILYLRPFAKDENFRSHLWFRYANYGIGEGREEALVRYLAQTGPVVAIGRPGEQLPPLGAAREYVGNADWQARVSELIERSQLIVLQAGLSAGFWWEFEEVRRRADPLRVVLYFPIESLWGRTARERRQLIATFKARANAILPRPIPDDLDDDELLIFDSHWRPEARNAMTWHPWSLVRGWATGSDLPHLRYGLKPVFARLGLPHPPIPAAPIEIITLPLFLLVLLAAGIAAIM
jgi:hypothetical protein